MLSNLTTVVRHLLIINVLLYLATIVTAGQGIDLVRILGGYYPGSPFFEPWQVVSHMFMHGSTMHIFFNMFALWMFGRTLERFWGSKRFLIYYMVCGLGAFFLHHFVNGYQLWTDTGSFFPVDASLLTNKSMMILATPAIGASGAVFGILLAFGVLFPNTRLMLLFPPIPIKAKYFVMIYGAIELYLGFANFQGDNIAHFAHLGGMLFGYLLIKYWQKSKNHFY